MKVVFNRSVPLRGYIAMTLWPFVFVRSENRRLYDAATENHEAIHGEQQKEMLVLPFLLWYGMEWLVRLLCSGDARKAYRDVSFEREARANEKDMEYIGKRKRYAWTGYL